MDEENLKYCFRSWLFGHPVYVDPREPQGRTLHKWRYEDTDELTKGAAPRACPECGEYETEDGHDPCIANLPGVRNACCGHGNNQRYIQLDDENRTHLEGEAMNNYLRKYGRYDGG